MAGELIDMSSQFKGLPMADLIGSPLTAACDAQIKLANATADFIRTVGFMPPTDPADTKGFGPIRKSTFAFTRGDEEVEMEVPLLALVKVPALSITRVDITFDMEVKSSSSSKESADSSAKVSGSASFGWGMFKVRVNVEGSVATHKENTRSSDNSAKYHIEVHAEDRGAPEGLSRVLDIMYQAITPPAPKQVENV